jgi:hypothetical protein
MGLPAKADNPWYGESANPVGLSGSVCHQVCPTATRKSTKRYASTPTSPMPYGLGRDVGCRIYPLRRGKGSILTILMTTLLSEFNIADRTINVKLRVYLPPVTR